jgi:hypothetical protein
MVVGRVRRRLQNENVGAADVFLDLDEDFHVGEAPHDGLGQRGAEVAADGFGKGRVGIAGDEPDSPVVARHSLFSCAPGSDFRRPDTSRVPGWQHESGPCPRKVFLP